ncbi:HEAT repeat domain-containing protein [Melittangium boletus]|uniref:HEAT repeat domain-containing protein n=1 Tax=Melittangium boletus TaxID=83453 RepID=UPI003DA32135
MSLPRAARVLGCLWGLVLPGCVRSIPAAERESVALESIARWEDHRSLGEGRLVALASEGSPEVRVRALRALARIQDASTLEVFVQALKAPAVSVREEAAFGLGVMALAWEPLVPEEKARMTRALLAAEATEAEVNTRLTLLEALGRLATPDAVARLGARLAHGPGELAGRAALALGVAMRQGTLLDKPPLARAGELMRAAQPETSRYGGAYLLANAKRADALPGLRRGLGDESPDIRALCVKGLGSWAGRKTRRWWPRGSRTRCRAWRPRRLARSRSWRRGAWATARPWIHWSAWPRGPSGWRAETPPRGTRCSRSRSRAFPRRGVGCGRPCGGRCARPCRGPRPTWPGAIC